MPPKTSAQRQAKLKAIREAQGMVRRSLWATPEEHEQIKKLLTKLRS